jgi:hypothetical protein
MRPVDQSFLAGILARIIDEFSSAVDDDFDSKAGVDFDSKADK